MDWHGKRLTLERIVPEPDLLEYLYGFLTKERRSRIGQILEQRTNQLTVVLEDIYDPHNASAVLRTCDAMGIQTVHSIQTHHVFQARESVSMGSGKWIDLVSYKETPECFSALRAAGYRIVAASPNPDALPIQKFKMAGRVALLFGSERDGLSQYAKENADDHITITMLGFAESLNLSVSAALCIQNLRAGCSERLSPAESRDVEFRWVCGSLRDAEGLIARFGSGN